MKSASLILGAAFLAVVAGAQTTPGAPAATTPAAKPTSAATKSATPAKAEQAAPAKVDKKVEKKADKKADEMGTIEGQTIARSNGKFLGLTLRDGKFVLSFYDEKKKPAKVDVTRATARWNDPHSPGYKRAVLNVEAGGVKLAATTFVRPPYAFKVWISLLRGEGEDAQAVESYVVDFRG